MRGNISLCLSVAAVIAVPSCNTERLNRFVESDNHRFFNQLVETRSAVFGKSQENSTDRMLSTAKLVSLQESQYGKADARLCELQGELVHLAERRAQIVAQAQTIQNDIDDFNAAGALEKLVIATRIRRKAVEAAEIAAEVKRLISSLDEWDTKMEDVRIGLDLGTRQVLDRGEARQTQ